MTYCELRPEFYCIGANVFDRKSLQITVKLIRNHNPSLALRIQNILAPAPGMNFEPGLPPEDKDLFPLNLDNFTLRRVIETLAIAGQEIAEAVLTTQNGDEEFLEQTNRVVGLWLLYAKEQRALAIPS